MPMFRTPFSRAYWRAATAELKNVRMWVLAALITAIRIALKSVRIPILENLYISVGFLPNAVGSMLYGPVIAALSGLVSDTLGALLFPIGPYFPPFAIVEVAGSVLFALFLYRAPLSIPRVAVSKLSVSLICNVLLTPVFLAMMQGRAVVLTSLPRIIKNIVLFPLETLLLVLLLDALMPALKGTHLLAQVQPKLKPTARHFVLLGVLLLVGAACVYLYYRYFLLPG